MQALGTNLYLKCSLLHLTPALILDDDVKEELGIPSMKLLSD